MSRIALAAALALMLPTLASAGETLHVYGPGGPLPAMKEAAAAFGAAHGITVEVTAGPTPTWIEKAKADADGSVKNLGQPTCLSRADQPG